MCQISQQKRFKTNKDTVPSFAYCVQLKDKQTQIHLKASDSKAHPTEREVKRPNEQSSMFCALVTMSSQLKSIIRDIKRVKGELNL